jgi:hypothetical protein
MGMKTLAILTLLFAPGILLVVDQAAASLKRAIVLERTDVGFPRLIDTWEQQRLRLAPIPQPSPEKIPVEGLAANVG